MERILASSNMHVYYTGDGCHTVVRSSDQVFFEGGLGFAHGFGVYRPAG